MVRSVMQKNGPRNALWVIDQRRADIAARMFGSRCMPVVSNGCFMSAPRPNDGVVEGTIAAVRVQLNKGGVSHYSLALCRPDHTQGMLFRQKNRGRVALHCFTAHVCT